MTRDEWRNIPTIAPYTWGIRRNGLFERAEVDIYGVEHKFENLPPAPYELVAVPHRTGLPEMAIVILPGNEPIWLHCRRQVYGLDNGGRMLEPLLFEYPLIGWKAPDGRECVWAIYPDGETAIFNSVTEAVA